MSDGQVTASSCGGRCCTCALNGGEAAGSWHGWRLVLASVATFLFPLVAALIGAWAGGGHAHLQLAGCLMGFSVGALLAKGLTALLAGFKAPQHDPARV